MKKLLLIALLLFSGFGFAQTYIVDLEGAEDQYLIIKRASDGKELERWPASETQISRAYANDGTIKQWGTIAVTAGGSAPYNNTIVNWFTRDNAEGSLNSGNGVSPGSPIDFDAAPPVGTGASDTDYEPDGATRVLANGLISAYSGADSAGLEASPLMPLSAMSQVVAQPLFIADTGDGGDSGVAIASPYVGTAKIYEWNDTTKSLDLAYTMPLTRNGVTVTSKNDQKHPAAGLISNDAQASNTLVGQLNAGVIIADVPITVVVQNGTPGLTPTIRSQNGTTTSALVTQDDETLSLGWTPPTLKAEITEGVDGILYKRVVAGPAETWEVA